MDFAILTVLLLLGTGALATFLTARIFPLWLLEAGQQHGRFALLESSEPPAGPSAGGGLQAPALPRWLAQAGTA